MDTLFCGVWDRAAAAGYGRACFGEWVAYSADNAERLAAWLLARAEKFRAQAQHNHCVDNLDTGPMRVALAYEALAYELL